MVYYSWRRRSFIDNLVERYFVKTGPRRRAGEGCAVPHAGCRNMPVENRRGARGLGLKIRRK